MKFSNSLKSNLSAAVLGVLALGLTCTSAVAATATTTFAVTATVQATCTVTATGMGFGTYISTAASTSTSTVTVTCTNGTTYNVGLNAGATSGATVLTRQMKNGTTNLLSYGLFSDAGHNTNWGDTLGSWVGGSGNGNAQVLTVYGQVAADQYSAPGAYTDTITATVNY